MIKFLFTLLIAISTSLLFVSCGGMKDLAEEISEAPTDELPPRIISGRIAVDLYNFSKTDTTASSISYEYYSMLQSPVEDSVNCLIKKLIRENTDFDTDESTSCDLSHSFIQAQLDSFAHMFSIELDEGYDFGTWSLEISTDINEDFKDFVELGMYVWSYTGGAHGNGYSDIYYLDKQSGETIWLEDMFTDIKALNAIAEPIFRKSEGLSADEDLNNAGYWFDESKFHLNNNFKFTGGELVFIYNPYEITSYAAGPIEIAIPIEQIKHLLNYALD